MANAELKFVVKPVVANNGDTIVFGFNKRLTHDEAREIDEKLSRLLPNNKVVIVSDCSSIVVENAENN